MSRIGETAWLFPAGRALCAAVCYGALRLRVSGREHVPSDGPLVVACNHLSYLDPVALGVALPRPISYMAKTELFDIPVFGRILGWVGTFPVDRGKGDIAAIRASLAQLKKGRAVGIFPEGTRNLSGSAEIRPGVALLASLAKAPVLPAFVSGGPNAKRFGQMSVAFGEPLDLASERKATREELANWTQEIMARIRALGESTGAH